MNHVKLVLAIMVGSVAQLVSAEPADIRFYADNYCTGKHVAYFDSQIASRANCTFGKTCRNDVYRSIWLKLAIKADTVVKVWDSPDASVNDDWAQINLKQPAT